MVPHIPAEKRSKTEFIELSVYTVTSSWLLNIPLKRKFISDASKMQKTPSYIS